MWLAVHKTWAVLEAWEQALTLLQLVLKAGQV